MNERPLNEYLDMEAYDVVSGEKYRELQEQLEAAHSTSLENWHQAEKFRQQLEAALVDLREADAQAHRYEATISALENQVYELDNLRR